MYTPNRETFGQLARGATLVPVYREIVADLETPVSAMAKLGVEAPCFLLESVEGGESLGRYSFLGHGARGLFRSEAGRSAYIESGGTQRVWEGTDPLDALREVMARRRPAEVPGLPRFYGGAVGFLGYDAVRRFERLPDQAVNDLGMPDALYLLTRVVVIFDHVKRTIKVVAMAEPEAFPTADAAYEDAIRQIEATIARLQRPSTLQPLPDGRTAEHALDPSVVGLRSNVEKEAFLRAVEQAKAYIRAGDIFQVVLSQRLSTPLSVPPFEIYRWLRTVNPSPYLFYLSFDEVTLVGSSPEVHVQLDGSEARLRPIAGTRPRGTNPDEDARLEQELLADAKERAEHVMLVDLGRNDLGRVCRYGSVQVKEFMVVERYSHVMHLVSDVRGELQPGHDAYSLLRATFPAGTVTGAPKVRAMEIIDELEPTRRGTYAGAIGYIGFSGNMDTCIAIRTLAIKDGVAHVQAGAGIMADSDPETEYHESLHKARALIRTIALAQGQGGVPSRVASTVPEAG